jgi:hypothetical protein
MSTWGKKKKKIQKIPILDIFVLCIVVLAIVMIFGLERKSKGAILPPKINIKKMEKMESSLIPRAIFQTYKSMEEVEKSEIRKQSMQSWKKFESDGYSYTFFDDKRMHRYMEEEWKGPVEECYRHLQMMVMKADLWRYCILYQYGGIYADMDTICMTSPLVLLGNNSSRKFVVALEYDETLLCQWVFASAPGHPILGRVIQKIVEREKEWRGKPWPNEHHIHFLTGPSVFTEAFDDYLHSLLQIDDSITIKENLKNKKQLRLHYPQEHPIFQEIELLPTDFHDIHVHHQFLGFAEDGWKAERQKYVPK